MTKRERRRRARTQGRTLLLLAVVILALSLMLSYRNWRRETPAVATAMADFNAAIEAKWHKPLDQLPLRRLVVISPHDARILREFDTAFCRHHALTYGERVLTWIHEASSSGSGRMLDYLLGHNDGEGGGGADVVFGGGVAIFERLRAADLLAPLELAEAIQAQIPLTLNGQQLRDPDGYWCGNSLSGFGILYNRPQFAAQGLADPQAWDDLARPELCGRLVLADPLRSGSAAATYEIIVQTASDWPTGWALLLDVLSNARELRDSSVKAADAPLLGDAAATTCIDFFGWSRAAVAPDMVAYVEPLGQTCYTADPIAILQNASDVELAQRFVDFVLSLEGQRLWALPPGVDGGPVATTLNRTPIRRDFYVQHTEVLAGGRIDPYATVRGMEIDVDLWTLRQPVLAQLVHAATSANMALMQAARQRLVELDMPADRVAVLHELPENVSTKARVLAVAAQLADAAQAEPLVAQWREFFRAKYAQLVQ